MEGGREGGRETGQLSRHPGFKSLGLLVIDGPGTYVDNVQRRILREGGVAGMAHWNLEAVSELVGALLAARPHRRHLRGWQVLEHRNEVAGDRPRATNTPPNHAVGRGGGSYCCSHEGGASVSGGLTLDSLQKKKDLVNNC